MDLNQAKQNYFDQLDLVQKALVIDGLSDSEAHITASNIIAGFRSWPGTNKLNGSPFLV